MHTFYHAVSIKNTGSRSIHFPTQLEFRIGINMNKISPSLIHINDNKLFAYLKLCWAISNNGSKTPRQAVQEAAEERGQNIRSLALGLHGIMICAF